jgi:hypothetical protein
MKRKVMSSVDETKKQPPATEKEKFAVKEISYINVKANKNQT